MPTALTSPYLDTGEVATHTLSFTAEVLASPNAFAHVDSLDVLVGGPAFELICRPSSGATFSGGVWSSVDLRREYIDSFAVFHSDVLESVPGSASPGLFSPVTIEVEWTDLRLGVTLDSSLTLKYGWFHDDVSIKTWTVGGTAIYSQDYTAFVGTPPFLLGWGFSVSYIGSTSARFASFSFNGSGLGVGPYSVPTDFPAGASRYFGPSFQATVDLAAVDFAGLAAAVDCTSNGARTTPVSYTQSQLTDGVVTVGAPDPSLILTRAVLADPWLSAQTVRPYSFDRYFTFEGNRPLDPGGSSYRTWDVGTLTIASPIDTHLSTSAYVSSNIAKLTVAGGPALPGAPITLNCITTGATVTKTFVTHWLNWNTPADPLYQSGDLYKATKHNAYSTGASTPDVWGWGGYAFCDVTLTAPSSTTLTFTITWQVLDVETGFYYGIERNYDATFPNGASTQRLDLLFPTEGNHPFHGDRIYSIKIAGFNVGSYTLSNVQLVADQQAYLKLGGWGQSVRDWAANSLPETRGSGVVLAQDGQFSSGQWGNDSFLSPTADQDGDGANDRSFDYQNGIFDYSPDGVTPLVRASYGGAFGQDASSITTLLADLNRIEGITTTTSLAAMNADLVDSFGRTITGDVVTWIEPAWPVARVTKNVAYTIKARMVARNVQLVAGRDASDQKFFQRKRLGGSIEAQGILASGARCSAGSTARVRARGLAASPSVTDPVIATGTTDASGYVSIPIPTGEVNTGGVYTPWVAYLDAG